MAKKIRNKAPNAAVTQIFEDLDAYREFCRDFGYRFDESDLYNMRKYPFQQYNKFRNGKNAKNQWEVDRRRLS
jgi:hypothetical protein